MRVLSHGAFARSETLRKREYTEQYQFVGPGCRWCGMTNRTPKGRSFLYVYGSQSDAFGARVSWESHAFCSKSCHDSFTA